MLWSWLKRLANWVATAATADMLWLTVGVNAVAVLVALRPGTTEPMVRWTGLVVQWLGIGTVIWGIRQTRQLFNHPSLLTSGTAWLKSFPRFRRDVVVNATGLSVGAATMRARAYVTSNPPPMAGIEERVASLERNIRQLNGRIDDALREFDMFTSQQGTALEREAQHRATEDARVASLLEVSGTGGLNISAIGAVWLQWA